MALPNYSQSGFYDPQKDYRTSVAGSFQFPRGGLAQNIYGTSEAPQAAWMNNLQRLGLSGLGARARTAQGLYGQAQIGYEQAKMNDNVELMFPEFLEQTDVGRMIDNMSFENQGLDPQRFGQRKYRWSQRAG